MCVSPTFASPIEKPTTSTRRRICREIIGNTEGNAKTEDSLRHCKWANFTSKSAPKTKKPTGGPVGGESKKWSTILGISRNLLSTSKLRIFQIPPDGVLQQSRKILCEIHKKLHNLKMRGSASSPDDFEHRFGLDGIQKTGTNV